MPRFIVKIKDKFLEWSTVVDAPVTYGMTEEEFREHYREEYGARSMHDLEARMDRVRQKGTSSLIDENVESLLKYNRAGPNESCLTMDEIYKRYCTGKGEGCP